MWSREMNTHTQTCLHSLQKSLVKKCGFSTIDIESFRSHFLASPNFLELILFAIQSGALWLAGAHTETANQPPAFQPVSAKRETEREGGGTILQTLIHQAHRHTHTHTHRGHISYIK